MIKSISNFYSSNSLYEKAKKDPNKNIVFATKIICAKQEKAKENFASAKTSKQKTEAKEKVDKYHNILRQISLIRTPVDLNNKYLEMYFFNKPYLSPQMERHYAHLAEIGIDLQKI